MNNECLIWSIEHTAWWALLRRGYTKDYQQAGRYTSEEAAQIVRDANHDARACNECMIPIDCLGLTPIL